MLEPESLQPLRAALERLAKGFDAPVTCLRSVLMKPEHEEWLGRIWTLLDESTRAAQA